MGPADTPRASGKLKEFVHEQQTQHWRSHSRRVQHHHEAVDHGTAWRVLGFIYAFSPDWYAVSTRANSAAAGSTATR